MTASKIAISLPPKLVAQVRDAVDRGCAESVSAYVATALEEKVKLDDLASLLREMLEETGGPLSAEERRRADEVLGVAQKSRKARKLPKQPKVAARKA